MNNIKYAIMAMILAFGTANAAQTKNSIQVGVSDIFVSYNDAGANRTDSEEVRIGLSKHLSGYTDSDTEVGLQGTVGGGGLYVSLWTEYQENDNFVAGTSVAINAGSVSLKPRVNWNTSNGDIDSDLTASVMLLDIDVYSRSWWDWEMTDAYLGSDFGAGWTIQMTEKFSVRPYYEIPLDDDWNDGERTAGINVNLAF